MYYVVVSGKRKSKIGQASLDVLKEKLDARKIDYKLMISRYPGHSTELTREACAEKDCEAVIAFGGDGTYLEVLNGLDTRIPIGFIVAGTGNDFARTLGFSADIDECLDNIIGKEPVHLDYLKAGDRRAFNLVGSGFDIQLLKREARIRKHFKSRLSYHVSLFLTIFFIKFPTIRFRVDDREEEEKKFFMVDCCNGRWGGGMMPLCVDADPRDSWIDFVIIRKFSRIKLLPLLIRFKKGKLATTKYVERVRCKKVEMEILPKLEFNLDGELIPKDRITVEIVHGELKYFPSSKEPIDPIRLLNSRKLKKESV